MNNGVATPLFSVGKGVRQGDPLSLYLFILALETLPTAIRQNQDIKGIVVDVTKFLLLIFRYCFCFFACSYLIVSFHYL